MTSRPYGDSTEALGLYNHENWTWEGPGGAKNYLELRDVIYG